MIGRRLRPLPYFGLSGKCQSSVWTNLEVGGQPLEQTPAPRLVRVLPHLRPGALHELPQGVLHGQHVVLHVVDPRVVAELRGAVRLAGLQEAPLALAAVVGVEGWVPQVEDVPRAEHREDL